MLPRAEFPHARLVSVRWVAVEVPHSRICASAAGKESKGARSFTVKLLRDAKVARHAALRQPRLPDRGRGGVWDFARGACGPTLILRERSRSWRRRPRRSRTSFKTLAQVGTAATTASTGRFTLQRPRRPPRSRTQPLRRRRCCAARAYQYERLDQPTTELLLGVLFSDVTRSPPPTGPGAPPSDLLPVGEPTSGARRRSSTAWFLDGRPRSSASPAFAPRWTARGRGRVRKLCS